MVVGQGCMRPPGGSLYPAAGTGLVRGIECDGEESLFTFLHNGAIVSRFGCGSFGFIPLLPNQHTDVSTPEALIRCAR